MRIRGARTTFSHATAWPALLPAPLPLSFPIRYRLAPATQRPQRSWIAIWKETRVAARLRGSCLRLSVPSRHRVALRYCLIEAEARLQTGPRQLSDSSIQDRPDLRVAGLRIVQASGTSWLREHLVRRPDRASFPGPVLHRMRRWHRLGALPWLLSGVGHSWHSPRHAARVLPVAAAQWVIFDQVATPSRETCEHHRHDRPPTQSLPGGADSALQSYLSDPATTMVRGRWLRFPHRPCLDSRVPSIHRWFPAQPHLGKARAAGLSPEVPSTFPGGSSLVRSTARSGCSVPPRLHAGHRALDEELR